MAYGVDPTKIPAQGPERSPTPPRELDRFDECRWSRFTCSEKTLGYSSSSIAWNRRTKTVSRADDGTRQTQRIQTTDLERDRRCRSTDSKRFVSFTLSVLRKYVKWNESIVNVPKLSSNVWKTVRPRSIDVLSPTQSKKMFSFSVHIFRINRCYLENAFERILCLLPLLDGLGLVEFENQRTEDRSVGFAFRQFSSHIFPQWSGLCVIWLSDVGFNRWDQRVFLREQSIESEGKGLCSSLPLYTAGDFPFLLGFSPPS